ncbi:unnamed protein product [Rhizoctonia solani]|uniref:Protein kinase domain-containing protein n=1 Tax=Rhizoctonia solani TaxID=456999 RepID=A0A8H3HDN0_9AGAM|nr:unnamed protein product [Rhizoctonia solani]
MPGSLGLDSPKVLASLEREILILGKLDLFNIYRLFCSQQVGPTSWLVTEYIDGTTLLQHLKKNGLYITRDCC